MAEGHARLTGLVAVGGNAKARNTPAAAASEHWPMAAVRMLMAVLASVA